jgi:hypothetical protein
MNNRNNRLNELLEKMSIHLIDMELLYKERGRSVINKLECDDCLNSKRECLSKEIKETVAKLAVYIPYDFSDFLDCIFSAINSKLLNFKVAYSYLDSIGGEELIKEMIDCQNSWLILLRKCFCELAFNFLKNEKAEECSKILESYGWEEGEGFTSENEIFNLSWDFLIAFDDSKIHKMQEVFDKMLKQ